MSVMFKSLLREDWGWVNSRQNIIWSDDTQGIMVYRDGKRVAAWVVDSYTGSSCSCHMIIEDPFVIRHGFFDLCSSFVFENLECAVAYAEIPANNARSLKLAEHVGFVKKCTLQRAFPSGEGLVIMELLGEECKFFPHYEEVA